MPTNRQAPARNDGKPGTRRSPFPRYEGISERLADEPRPEPDEPRDRREFEIPRTESYGELWQRAQARRLRR